MGKLTSLDVLDTLEVAPGRFVVTPHPVTRDGQTNVEAALLPGDTLHSFLSRSIDLSEQWEVSIGGVVVPAEHWLRVKPKHGQTIEARGAVNKQVLAIVALAALTYFTFGAESVVGLGGAYAGTGAYVAAAALYAGGSMVINKVLGPKPPKARNADDRESVFSLSAPRNRVRINEPLGLLFGGPFKIAPDVLSLPYTWYQGNDQYLAMVLTPGINVGRIAAYQNGDTPLASFDGVQTWTAGMAGMPNQPIPLYSNADTINGAELPNTGVWVERRTSIDTVRIQVNLEYLLGGQGTSSKSYNVSETAEFQYRPAGGTTWAPLTSRTFRNDDFNIKRDTLAADVARGEYDVRGRILGQGNYSGKNTQKNDFTWSTMTSVQADDTDYAGISRFAVQMKATGQLQGAPDEIRVEATADAMPIWNGTAWVTATDRASGLSNPGAQILQYARGFYDPNGKLIAGMGLDDELIDIPALQAFMLHCTANGYTYDYWLQSVRGHTETINAIALAGFGHSSWASGRLSVVWAAADQPLSGVVNMATIKKGQFQVDYTLANAADGVEFTYFDRTDWQAKTLRVPAPGVTTMLNPATIQGEGITDELHAAEMARYHVAQHIYQYKDISYSTRLEHLSYQRLSVLSLQHDLTQWGFGGRIRAAVDNGSSVTLTLDEPVPAPATGSAYIGLRIPGEAVFRVFTVRAFAGESDTITLIGAWPNDAALPGDVPENPAHDTIWIYDFKQTPGYRVRVVDIQPEPGMKGAGVAVVPEGPEFWNYVKTGDYVPAPNQSLLQTRPVASNLKISESQIVQGDTVFTELAVSFDVSGPVGSTVVLCGEVGNPIEEVAQTLTRTAKWRIPRAGVYTVVVRPISPDGMPGVSASINYTTSGADAPPRLFDFFDVQELSGGVRKYVFSHDDDPPANLAGAEIRYIAGNVPAPTWSAMTPLGVDGFFTSAVEMVIPVAGAWTFACRARNTSGTLSTAAKVLTKTLTGNLGEVIGGIKDDIVQSDADIAAAMQAALSADAKADQEVIDRQSEDARIALESAQDATNKAQAEAQARADALLAERLAWTAAVSTETTQRQSADASLAQSISMVSAGSGEQFDSAKIWRFDTTPDGWTGNGTPTVVDGWLRPANHATSPYVESPDNLDVDGSAFRYLKLRIQKVGIPVWRGYAQWTTTTDNTFNTAKRAQIAEPGFDANGRATIDFDDLPWWPATIRRLRITLSAAQTATDYYLLDWVAIGRPTPGASVALVQGVEQASIDRDGANALARETLAAQMRGTYTGTDVAQVTQGLVWSERQARVTAISAEASRIDGLQLKMPTDGSGAASSTVVNTMKGRLDNTGGGRSIEAVSAQSQSTATKINDPATGLDSKAAVTFAQETRSRIDNTGAGRTIEQVASAVLATEAALPEKADSVAFLALQSKVNNSTTGLDTKASSNALLQVDARLKRTEGPQSNLYPNPSGAAGLGSWGVRSPDTLSQLTVADVGAGYRFRFVASDAAFRLTGPYIRVVGGFDYALSADFNISPGADVQFSLYFYDSTGTYINRGGLITVRQGSGWERESSVGTAPANAVEARVNISGPAGQAGKNVHFRQIKIEQASASTPFTDDATTAALADAALSLRSDVTQQSGLISANANAILQANADIGGVGASVTQVMNAQVSSSGNGLVLKNPGFEYGFGWASLNDSDPSASGNLSAESSYAEISPHSGSRVMMFGTGAGGLTANRFNTTPNMRIDSSKRHRIVGWTRITQQPPAGRAYFQLRWYGADGTTVVGNNDTFKYWAGSEGWSRTVGQWVTPPAGAAFVRVLIGSNSQVAPLYLYYDDISVEVESTTDEAYNASYSIVLDVNGRVSGVKFNNTGAESSVDFLSDRFSVTSATGAGLQWTNGTLWNRRGNYSFLTGPTLGDGMVFYIGATPASPGAATKAKAGLSFDTTGNLEVRGKVKSSILESSALQAGSTRIHTINGRLAPFVITAGGMVSSANDQAQTMIIGPFHSPDATLTDQFHPRRLAFFKQDVIIEASAIGYSTEKLEILCQYNGTGGWIPIVDYTTDRGAQGQTIILIRYTTRATNWHTLHFLIRTGINRSKTLTTKIHISNFNESGNVPESNSGVTGGDAQGSLPPANGGGGNPYNPGEQIVNP